MPERPKVVDINAVGVALAASMVLAKEKVMAYLSEIAMADGHVAAEERRLLERVGKSLGVLADAEA